MKSTSNLTQPMLRRFKIGENSMSMKNWDRAIDSFTSILENGNSSLDVVMINYQAGLPIRVKPQISRLAGI